MLEEVLSLFCQRYGLKGPDDSEGCRVIQGAIAGKVPIAEVRRVLTTKYELFPQYGTRVMEILDSLEETAADSVVPAAEDAAVPLEQPQKRGRKKS